jgi:hypothetical protein
MILKKLVTAMFEQNWPQILLEILIVVVGIFLGLQVDDWNEARKDRNDEMVYLQRIVADLDISLEETARSRDFQQRHGEMGLFVLNALEDCELAEADRDRFASAVYLLAKIAPRAFVLAAIGELTTTGRMTIIRNTDLRQHLVRMVQDYSDHLFYLQAVDSRMAPHVNYVDSVAPVLVPGPIGGGREVTWDMLHADFDTLCADQRFYNSFASALNYNWDVTASLTRWEQRLQELKVSVIAEIGNHRPSAQ